MTLPRISAEQNWPAPANFRANELIGATGIVRDAHLPAYRKAGLTVAGVTDLDLERARSLAADWNLPETFSSDGVAAHRVADVVYDVAVPQQATTAVLADLPDDATVLIQKPMGQLEAVVHSIHSATPWRRSRPVLRRTRPPQSRFRRIERRKYC